MISPLVNAVAIMLGTLTGVLLRKGIPERLSESMMKAMGLVVIFVGIPGLLYSENVMIVVFSMILGTIIGEILDLDAQIKKLGINLENKFQKKEKKKGQSLAEGFITATLLFCVGAMAIIGSLQSGMTGNHEMIFAKSIMDGIIAIMLASSLGFGVFFSGIAVFIYQGTIVLLARLITPLLTYYVINEMTAIGSLVILALGFNILGMTKLKVMNLVPAIFLPIVLMMIF